jgi:hypothetical protein
LPFAQALPVLPPPIEPISPTASTSLPGSVNVPPLPSKKLPLPVAGTFVHDFDAQASFEILTREDFEQQH